MNTVCSFSFSFHSISFYCFFDFVHSQYGCNSWQRSRDDQGIIQPDPQDFPSGVPALADYIHSRKLKFGHYSGIVARLIWQNPYHSSEFVRCWN